MARFTLKQVVASLPPGRIRIDSPLTTVLFRPLSFVAAWGFLALGLSPNAVTYFSAALCVAGFGFMVAGATWTAWVGIALFFLFDVLDCTDGNMARVRKTASAWGEWVDAFGGYTAYTTLLLAAGVMAEAQSSAVLPGVAGFALPWTGGWVLVSGAAAAANLFMRTIYQARRAVKSDPGRASVGIEKRLSEYLGLTGALLPLVAFGFAFGFLAWVVAGYAIFYCGGAFLVSIKLIRQVESEIAGGP